MCVSALQVVAVEYHGTVGCDGGFGVITPGQRENPCGGTLLLSWDGTAECGYCWAYGGCVPPYYGAFAECYQHEGSLCGIQLILTGIGYPCYGTDLYVWEDAGGIPGNVLSITPSVDPCPVAVWPNLSTHDFAIDPLPVSGVFWVGFWTDTTASQCPCFVAADCYGPDNGCRMTNIAPGLGYPSGWQECNIVWGPTAALGIGAWCLEPGNPSEATSWGKIKTSLR